MPRDFNSLSDFSIYMSHSGSVLVILSSIFSSSPSTIISSVSCNHSEEMSSTYNNADQGAATGSIPTPDDEKYSKNSSPSADLHASEGS